MSRFRSITPAQAYKRLCQLFWRELPYRRRTQALYRAGVLPAPRDPNVRLPQTLEQKLLEEARIQGRLAELFLSLPRDVRIANAHLARVLQLPQKRPNRKHKPTAGKLRCRGPCGQLMPRHLLKGPSNHLVCEECLEPATPSEDEGGSRHLVDEARRKRSTRYGTNYNGGVG